MEKVEGFTVPEGLGIEHGLKMAIKEYKRLLLKLKEAEGKKSGAEGLTRYLFREHEACAAETVLFYLGFDRDYLNSLNKEILGRENV